MPGEMSEETLFVLRAMLEIKYEISPSNTAELNAWIDDLEDETGVRTQKPVRHEYHGVDSLEFKPIRSKY